MRAGVVRLAWHSFSARWAMTLLWCLSVAAAGALLFFSQAEKESGAGQQPYFAQQALGKYDVLLTAGKGGGRRRGAKGMGMKDRPKSTSQSSQPAAESPDGPPSGRRSGGRGEMGRGGPGRSGEPGRTRSGRGRGGRGGGRGGRPGGGGKVDPAAFAKMMATLKADPNVAECAEMITQSVTITEKDVSRHHPSRANVVIAPFEAPPFDSSFLKGQWYNQGENVEGVFNIKTRLGFGAKPIAVGDTVMFKVNDQEVPVRVCGLIDMPNAPRAYPRIFLNAAFLKYLKKPSPSSAYIRLKSSADLDAFLETHDQTAADLGFTLNDPNEVRLSPERKGASRLQFRSYTLTLMAGPILIYLAISTLLSRQRTALARLRATGMTQWQYLRLVLYQIFAISALASLLSWLLGFIGIALFVQTHANEFPAGVLISWTPFALSAGCLLTAGVVAAVPLLWRSWREDILTGLQERDIRAAKRPGRWRYFVAPPLMIVLPLACSSFDLPAELRSKLFWWAGMPLFGLGLLVIMPLLVYWVEKILSPLLAPLFGLPTALLRSQLATRLRSSTTIVICLLLGLGLYIAIRTWGHSMSVPFYPTSDLPDAVITFKPDGLDRQHFSEVENMAGVRAGDVTPVLSRQHLLSEVTQKRLENDKRRVLKQNTVLMTGVDVRKSFLGENPIVGCPFVDGDRNDAAAKLATGDNYCIIPETFANHLEMGVGGTFGVQNNDGKDVELKIAGVIAMPWHLLTAWTGMRGLEDNPFGCLSVVLISPELAKQFADTSRTRFFWANLPPADAKTGFSNWGPTITAEVRRVAKAAAPEGTPPQMVAVFPGGELAGDAKKHSDDILKRYCEYPTWVLAITLLAVLSHIAAGVTARRRELGLLSAIGMDWSQMFRIILAESVMIGLCASLASLGAAVLLAWSVLQLDHFTFTFTALPLRLLIPWGYVLSAIGLSILGCILAALIPAAIASGKSTLALLNRKGS